MSLSSHESYHAEEDSRSLGLCCCYGGEQASGEKTPLLENGGKRVMVKSPEEDASFCSQLFFSWMTKLLGTGAERPLGFEDLYPLHSNDTVNVIMDKFKRNWNRQVESGNPSVFWALAWSFGGPFLSAGFMKLIHDMLIFVGPIVLKYIIAFLKDPNAPVEHGYYYVAALFTSNVIQSFCLRQYFFQTYRTGLRLRSAVVSAVYEKTLRLSKAAHSKKTAGEITNLMSVDAQRLQDLTPYLHGVWYGILQISISCVFLWQQMGPSCLGGIAVIILMIPMTAVVANLMKRLQKKLMEIKDDRLKLCYEVLSGIKVIKLQAWEGNFVEKVMGYRKQELIQLQKYVYTNAASGTLYTCTPTLVAVATFAVYVSLGHQLDVGTALTSLALFNILRFPLVMLPSVVNSVVEAQVSFKRLKDFFLCEDRVAVTAGELTSTSIKIVHADFSWGDGSSDDEPMALYDINTIIHDGELVGIIGSVGSGKTAFVHAILGEIVCVKGQVMAKGNIAYVSQQPFIMNATLKDNILFGKPYHKQRYKTVVRACALEPDLDILPAGDMTEIGEKGINLSGGQRTRVALARAVYQDTDIIIMDDPLSAVDSHVGKHIFENCIAGLLKNKLRVIVTNDPTYIQSFSKTIVLSEGRIETQGNAATVAKSPIVLTLMKHVSSSMNLTATSAKAKSSDTVEDEKPLAQAASGSKEGEKLMESEDRSTGQVTWALYNLWIASAGGVGVAILCVASYVLSAVLQVIGTVWLSYWSENGENTESSQYWYLYMFIAINGSYFVMNFIRLLLMYMSSLQASKRLFHAFMQRIVHAPMHFFHTTPLGRIMNRFSKDIYTVDEQIPTTVSMYLACMIAVAATGLTITVVTPWFVVVMIPIGLGYYSSQRYFIKSSRELQRLDSISRSPVYALLNETLDGRSTIMAYNAANQFNMRNKQLLDRNQRAVFLSFSANCWLALRLEFAGTIIATGAALLAVMQHATASERFAGMAGVSISYAISVTQTLNWSVRMMSQLETQMVSVERLAEYSTGEIERRLESDERWKPKPDWPREGAIEMRRVEMRYRKGLPLVLKGIDFKIRAREKIGVVGRTGAGKSSLITVIMRLSEIDTGEVYLDGVNLATIGLHDLRRKISVIPQDPMLFSGTIRDNLDPLFEHSDDQLWNAITHVQLKDSIICLDQPVAERGNNMSVGERQLLCMARALLRKSKLILLDEASASLDVTTDKMTQKSIRTEFQDCTCITIAHRLDTILDSDRVMVMANGKIVEFDKPEVLLKKDGGIFQSMVQSWKKD